MSATRPKTDLSRIGPPRPMREGDRRGGRWHRAAAWSVIAFLPMAAVAVLPFHGSASAGATSILSGAWDGGVGASALLRGGRSDIFGAFAWDGATAQGSFVQLSFSPATGILGPVVSRQGNDSTVVVEWATTLPYSTYAPPVVDGPLFVAQSANVTITAHDDASGLVEFRTLASGAVLALRLNGTVTGVTGEPTTTWWPQATLSFTAAGNVGRLFLGAGSFSVTGSTVYATMSPNDLLALRLTPSSADAQELRGAVMEAFASGRLAAEFGLVATSDGGWIENSARYRRALVTTTQGVLPGNASVRLTAMARQGGLVLLAFDLATMPADAGHRILIEANGSAIPEVDNPYALLYGNLSPSGGPAFARLGLGATTLLVYLPSLDWTTVQVTSLPAPPTPADVGSEVAAVLALALVSIAAAVMFRRPAE